MLSSLYLFGGWAIRLAMIPVVARRHRPYVALSWLAPIFLLPVLGTVLYFWLNRYGLDRNARRHREVRRRVETDDRLREQDRFRSDDVAPRHRDLVRLGERMSTRRLGGFPILDGNAVELLSGQEETVNRLIRELDRARDTAHLLFYFFADDSTGRRVAEALERASRRGVRCRVLVDAWMSSEMYDRLRPGLTRSGVRVEPVLPMSFVRRPLRRVDIRNHRKVAVIDGRIALTGSANLHDPDHALEEGEWHQLSVCLEGPAALQLQMIFVEDWFFATDEVLDGPEIFPPPQRAGEVTVHTVPGGPSYGANLLQHLFVQVLSEADERITLVTPYFIPDEPTLLALQLAALRGVEVDLIVPERSDMPFADAAGRAYFQEMLDAGVRIHLHSRGLLHAKALTVDDSFCVIGTANFDRRSFFLNYELVLVIFGRDLAARTRETLHRFREEARPVDPEQWRRRPETRRILEHTARLASAVL